MTLFTWISLLSGGFEGSLSPWYVGNGGGSSTWVAVPFGSLGYEPDGSGTYYAACIASSSESYADTLFSPSVYVVGYDSLLLTYAYAFEGKGYWPSDFGSVIVRYHDGSSWGSWMEVRRYDRTDKGKDTIYLNLGYDSIQVGFVYHSPTSAYWFAVDDVEIKGRRLLAADMEAKAILSPGDLHYRGEYINPLVRVSNLGSSDNHALVRLYILYSGDTVYRNQLSIDLTAGDSADLPFSWFIPDSVGMYEAIAIVLPDSDYYPPNDTVRKTFKVWPYPEIVFEIPYAHSINLDGNLEPGEWSSAHRVDVSNYFGRRSPPTDTGVVYAYLQHDGSFLNILVRTGDTTYDSTDALYIFLDDNGDRAWNEGEGLSVIRTSSYTGWSTLDSGRAHVFPRKDLIPNVARLGGDYEVRIPIRPSSDPAVLSRRVGEHIGMFIAYFEGRIGKFTAWWPQVEDTFPSRTYLTLQRPTNWHDMGVDLLPVTCEAARVCSTAVVLYDNSSLRMDVETLRLRVERNSDVAFFASRVVNTVYRSVDTLYFRWIPPDSGYYRVTATLTPDDSPHNDTSVYYLPVGRAISPPYFQDFEGRWPPPGWRVEGRGWVLGHYLGDFRVSPTLGASGERFAEFLSFVLPSSDSSSLHLPPILPNGPFHIAFKFWNGPTWTGRGNNDRIDVYYRLPGSTVWQLAGSALGDSPSWRDVSFNMPYADTVYVKLVARSDYGDTDISLDDFAVLSGLSVDENPEKRTICSFENGVVRTRPNSEVEVYTVDGRLVASGKADPSGIFRIPQKRGVIFLLCGTVKMKVISPLK